MRYCRSQWYTLAGELYTKTRFSKTPSSPFTAPGAVVKGEKPVRAEECTPSKSCSLDQRVPSFFAIVLQWFAPIDETPFRTKGTVVVFGLTNM
jgi:hypothetical protein